MQTSEITNDHLIRALRIYVTDIANGKYSPFVKDEKYMSNLGSWLSCAASRIEKLSQSNVGKSDGL